MSAATTAPPERTAWMRGQLAKIERSARAQLSAAGVDLDDGIPTTVVHPLGRNGDPGSVQDRTCDRCGYFVPPGRDLHLLTVWQTAWLLVCGGLCGRCWDREVGR